MVKLSRNDVEAASRIACTALLLACVALAPASAQALSPVDQGFVSLFTDVQYLPGPTKVIAESLVHDPSSTRVKVGSYELPGSTGIVSYRDWVDDGYVLFQVPANLGAPLSAELRFDIAGESFPLSLSGGIILRLWDVSSPVGAFQTALSGARTPAGLALLDDLGGGATYGDGQLYADGAAAVTLGGSALVNLAAARGGIFGIGFSGDGTARYGLPEVTLSNLQLVVTTAAVPEPAPAVLLTAAVLTWAWRARLRRSAAAG